MFDITACENKIVELEKKFQRIKNIVWSKFEKNTGLKLPLEQDLRKSPALHKKAKEVWGSLVQRYGYYVILDEIADIERFLASNKPLMC